MQIIISFCFLNGVSAGPVGFGLFFFHFPLGGYSSSFKYGSSSAKLCPVSNPIPLSLYSGLHSYSAWAFERVPERRKRVLKAEFKCFPQ